MWKGYIPGESIARPIPVSKELRGSVERFCENKGIKIQDLFDTAVIVLWRIYNGNGETNDPKSIITEKKVRDILMNNPIPGEIQKKKKTYIYVTFRGEQTFEWVCKLEKLYMFHGLENFIRRVLSWYLRQEGYIQDSIAEEMQKKPQENMLQA